MKKYQCPCCGYFTYNVSPGEDCGYICPVCFWENDPFIASDDEPSDSNHGITLNEAKFNYLRFGACEEGMLRYVRPPQKMCIRDRCGDAAAAVDHNGGAVLADGHDGGVAQQAAKVQNIAGLVANGCLLYTSRCV